MTQTSIPLSQINDLHIPRALTVSVHVPQRVALGHGSPLWGTQMLPIEALPGLTPEDRATLVRLHDKHSAVVAEGFDVADVVAAIRRAQRVADTVAAIRARAPLETVAGIGEDVRDQPEVIEALADKDARALDLLTVAAGVIPCDAATLCCALVAPPASAAIASAVDKNRALFLARIDEACAADPERLAGVPGRLATLGAHPRVGTQYVDGKLVLLIGAHNGLPASAFPMLRAALDAFNDARLASEAQQRRVAAVARRALVEGVLAPLDDTALARLDAGFLSDHEIKAKLRDVLARQVAEGLSAAGIAPYVPGTSIAVGIADRITDPRPVRHLSAALFRAHLRLAEYAAGVEAGGAFAGASVTASIDLATVYRRDLQHPDADEEGDVAHGDVLRLVVAVDTGWTVVTAAVPVEPIELR